MIPSGAMFPSRPCKYNLLFVSFAVCYRVLISDKAVLSPVPHNVFYPNKACLLLVFFLNYYDFSIIALLF